MPSSSPGQRLPAKSAPLAGHGNSVNAPGHNKGSGSAPVVASVPAPVPNGGLIASLHAANANLQAFIHASPNSKVGQIAAYAMAAVDAEAAAMAADTAQMTFDMAAADLADATSALVDSLGVLTDTYGYMDTSTMTLETSLADLMALDPTTLTADQEAEMMALEQALADAAAMDTAQIAYDDANAALMTAEQELADAEAAATDALNAAANDNRTPVSDDVKAYVDTTLEDGGVLDYYRALAAAGGE